MMMKANGCGRCTAGGVDAYDLLIAVTDSDETNIVICSLAKSLVVQRP